MPQPAGQSRRPAPIRRPRLSSTVLAPTAKAIGVEHAHGKSRDDLRLRCFSSYAGCCGRYHAGPLHLQAPNAEALAKDADSRLLWRFPPRRLEAEAVRDSVLTASGAIDLAMYGPGYSVFEPNANYVRVYEPKSRFSRAEWRRMVYMFKVRMEQDAVFGAFDCPDAGQPSPRRGA